jgi:hypothetical protein
LTDYRWQHNFPTQHPLIGLTSGSTLCSSGVRKKNLHIHSVLQKQCTIRLQNVPYVNLHRQNPAYLHPKLNNYGDNSRGKRWYSCGSAYYTLRRAVLEPTAKPSHTKASVVYKVLVALGIIFKKFVRIFSLINVFVTYTLIRR